MVANFAGAQLGEVKSGDIAQHITNIHNQLGSVLEFVERDIAEHEKRLKLLEESQRRYEAEKQSLTSLLIGARNESRTIKDVHELLKSQINNERDERNKRRRYLDIMLSGVFIVAVLNLSLHIYRVLRGSGRPAQP